MKRTSAILLELVLLLTTAGCETATPVPPAAATPRPPARPLSVVWNSSISIAQEYEAFDPAVTSLGDGSLYCAWVRLSGTPEQRELGGQGYPSGVLCNGEGQAQGDPIQIGADGDFATTPLVAENKVGILLVFREAERYFDVATFGADATNTVANELEKLANGPGWTLCDDNMTLALAIHSEEGLRIGFYSIRKLGQALPISEIPLGRKDGWVVSLQSTNQPDLFLALVMPVRTTATQDCEVFEINRTLLTSRKIVGPASSVLRCGPDEFPNAHYGQWKYSLCRPSLLDRKEGIFGFGLTELKEWGKVSLVVQEASPESGWKPPIEIAHGRREEILLPCGITDPDGNLVLSWLSAATEDTWTPMARRLDPSSGQLQPPVRLGPDFHRGDVLGDRRGMCRFRDGVVITWCGRTETSFNVFLSFVR